VKLTLLAVFVGLVSLWRRGYFVRENLVTEPTLRRIRREAAMDDSEKDQSEMTRGRRGSVDGPTPTRALSRVGIR
jgi:hypothetical protein